MWDNLNRTYSLNRGHMGMPRLPEARRSRAVVAWIETSLADRADVLAARNDRTRSWVIRQALTEYLQHQDLAGGAASDGQVA
jgi:hypothetical protein